MTEHQHAVLLANKILDRPGSADPDDDLAVLSRSFLRAIEPAPCGNPSHSVQSCAGDERGNLICLLCFKDGLIAECMERRAALETACMKTEDAISQKLGKVLGFPWYKDDQKNFPGATDANGVCTGPYVAEDLAELAAKRILHLEDWLYGVHDVEDRSK